jgi:multicopper oxidase
MTERPFGPSRITRRAFVGGVLAAGFTFAAGCARDTSVAIPNDRIGAAEAARPHSGRTVAVELNPQRLASTSAAASRRPWRTARQFRAD